MFINRTNISTIKKYVSLCLLMPLFAFSQKLNRQVDEATGDTVLFTSFEKLSYLPPEVLTFSVIKTGSHYLLSLKVLTAATSSFTIKAGQKGYFTTDSGNTDSLYVFEDEIAAATDSLSSKCFIGFILNPSDVTILKKQKVVSVSIATSRGRLDYRIDPTYSDAFIKAFRLY